MVDQLLFHCPVHVLEVGPTHLKIKANYIARFNHKIGLESIFLSVCVYVDQREEGEVHFKSYSFPIVSKKTQQITDNGSMICECNSRNMIFCSSIYMPIVDTPSPK